MPSGLRAVVFDFDGVIVNSEPLHFYAFNEVLKQENIRILQEVIFYLASEIKEQFQATAVGPVGSASRAPQDTEP